MTLNSQQLRLYEHAPLAFGQLAPNDHIDHAKLVFQRDEYHAARGLWALATDNQTGNADLTAMFNIS